MSTEEIVVTVCTELLITLLINLWSYSHVPIGCIENDRFYDEGEKLPVDETRPCEVCYCIKGARKCTVKKCSPVIRGCVPKIHTEGSCCPTSYDCRRSIKFKRESRQNEDEEEEEEDNDSIDFFSLLFGSDDPKENEKQEEVTQTSVQTLPPFKSLPPSSSSLSTTESSFFDLIRAGLEIIDANADKIDSQLNNVKSSTTTHTITTTPAITPSNTASLDVNSIDNVNKKIELNYSSEIGTKATTTTVTSSQPLTSSVSENDNLKSTETITLATTTEVNRIRTSVSSNVNETKKLQTIKNNTIKTFPLTSTTLSIKSSTNAEIVSSTEKMSIVEKTTSSPTVKESSSSKASGRTKN